MDKRSKMMWQAAGYFITAVTIGGWVAVLAYWMHMHGWAHIRGLAITGAALIGAACGHIDAQPR